MLYPDFGYSLACYVGAAAGRTTAGPDVFLVFTTRLEAMLSPSWGDAVPADPPVAIRRQTR